MFDHIGFVVEDLPRARRFYDACTLGLPTIENEAGSFLIPAAQPRRCHSSGSACRDPASGRKAILRPPVPSIFASRRGAAMPSMTASV